MGTLSRRAERRAFWAILIAGAIARLVAWKLGGGLHPDEFYQYLEPAWWRLDGVGLTCWEWREGVRSWVLPGYNGAWMALLRAVGVHRGDVIGACLQLHWALVSLVLIVVAYRGGAFVARRLGARSGGADAPPAGWQGGLLAAAACALFPQLVVYSTHTLSELPSMLCLVSGIVLALEATEASAPSRKRALLVGALLALGVCIRITNAPIVLVVPIALFAQRRFAFVAWMIVGALGPVLLFGLVDALTWGKFLGSFIGYIRYNLIEGKAAGFGTSPWPWYFETLWHRAPIGLPLLLLPVVLGWRATWSFSATSLALVATLSSQAHKEERFVIAFWPFVLIAAAGVLGAWIASAKNRREPTRMLTRIACAAGLLVILGDSGAHLGGEENSFARARLEGQIAPARDGATGLLVDNTFYSGGALWFGDFPQLEFDVGLLGNPLVSHAVLRAGSEKERVTLSAGFERVFERQGVALWRRKRDGNVLRPPGA